MDSLAKGWRPIMIRRALILWFAVVLSPAAQAEDTLGKIGSVVSKGLKAAGNTIESTAELMENEENPAETRAKLDRKEAEVLAGLLAENEEARALMDVSAGYAAFDMRKVTVFPLSGGYGRGVAVSPDDGARTYMQMGTGGVGAAFGIGGFASQFVIMFETPLDFDRFIENGYDASADAGVMEGESRTTQTVQFTNGTSIFVLDKKGWRVHANAGGTKYWPDAALN